jgi:hypothetical protein
MSELNGKRTAADELRESLDRVEQHYQEEMAKAAARHKESLRLLHRDARIMYACLVLITVVVNCVLLVPLLWRMEWLWTILE